MDIVDLHDPQRVNKTPDDIKVLFSSGNFIQDEFKISHVELRYYSERTDEKLGNYSLITSFVKSWNQKLKCFQTAYIWSHTFVYST